MIGFSVVVCFSVPTVWLPTFVFCRLRLSVCFLCVGQLSLIYACCALGVCYVFIIAFAVLFGCHVVFNFLVRWRNDNMPGTRFGAVTFALCFVLFFLSWRRINA